MALGTKINALFALSIIALLGLSDHIQGISPNTTIVKTVCDGSGRYDETDLFAQSVAVVLAELWNVTPHHDFEFSNGSPYPTDFVFGHATCNTSIAVSDCFNCLHSAKMALEKDCAGIDKGEAVLVDCAMRYGTKNFNNTVDNKVDMF